MPRIITLQMEVTDEEAANFINRFVGTANAVIDDTVVSQPPAKVPTTSPDEPVLDSQGVPWSPEFHAATKTTKADGTWKVKKGCDKDALAKYESQYIVPKEPITSTEPAQKPAESSVPQMPMPNLSEASSMPQMPMPQPQMPMPQPQTPAVVTWSDLMNAYNALVGKVGEVQASQDVTMIYAENGVPNAQDLQTNETLRAKVHAAIMAKVQA